MQNKNDTWRVRINSVEVATVQIPNSDTDWTLITKFRQMVKDADSSASVSLVSDLNCRGLLI